MRCRGHLTVLGPDDRLPEPPTRTEQEILTEVDERIAAVEEVLAEWRSWARWRSCQTG